jgi:hypothetical protein
LIEWRVDIDYVSSIDALRELMQSEGKDIVKISPKSYAPSNGLDYCCGGLPSKDGIDYSVQTDGKEATDLYDQAKNLG